MNRKYIIRLASGKYLEATADPGGYSHSSRSLATRFQIESDASAYLQHCNITGATIIPVEE